MFNIKLEEKSRKMSFKALPVKIQQYCVYWGLTLTAPLPPGQLGLNLNKHITPWRLNVCKVSLSDFYLIF